MKNSIGLFLLAAASLLASSTTEAASPFRCPGECDIDLRAGSCAEAVARYEFSGPCCALKQDSSGKCRLHTTEICAYQVRGSNGMSCTGEGDNRSCVPAVTTYSGSGPTCPTTDYPLEPTSSTKSSDSVETSIDTDTFGERGCFNITDYNWGSGTSRAEGVWEGEFCVKMTKSEELSVTWTSNSDRRIYAAKAWVLPPPAEGQSLDLSKAVEVSEKDAYTTTVKLDSKDKCSTDKYTLKLAAYAKFADPCVPGTAAFERGDKFVENTDFPGWVQDVSALAESTAKDYTYVSIPIKCKKKTTPPDTTTRTGDKPPKKSSGFGDPHFETWTGDKFDYHGECDLVLIDNPNFMDGLGLKLHVRTTRISYYSYIERIAMKIGEDVLEFANDVEKFLINGKEAEPNRKYHKTFLSGFLIRRDKKSVSIRLSKENYKRGSPRIDFVARRTGFPAVVVRSEGTNIFEGSLGLLGDYQTGLKIARDGKTVLDGEDPTDFALEWQVRDTEPQLFKDARAPQYPAQCIPPAKMMGNRLGSSHMRAQAEELCSSWKEYKDECVFDVMATRDIEIAKEGAIKSA